MITLSPAIVSTVTVPAVAVVSTTIVSAKFSETVVEVFPAASFNVAVTVASGATSILIPLSISF